MIKQIDQHEYRNKRKERALRYDKDKQKGPQFEMKNLKLPTGSQMTE